MNTRLFRTLLFSSLMLGLGPPARADERIAFPLGVSKDGRYLVDAQKRPFLYQADTAWKLLVALNLDEAEAYLKARKNQGFTVIQLMLTGFQGDKNQAGHLPFLGEDFAKTNEAYFKHVDAVFEKAAQQGMALFVAPLWAGCCGEGWAGQSKATKDTPAAPKPMNVNGSEKNRAFGKWLATRYAKHNHIGWILGGDNDPGNTREIWRALAQGLKAGAPEKLITYHAASSHSSVDAWPQDAPWLDVSMIYTYFRGFNKAWNKNQPDVYEEAARARAQTPAKPFFLGESTYEGEHDAWGSARQARKQAYWAVLGGASGHAYGSPNWHLREDWRKVAMLPGAESLRYLRHLFTVRPFFELEPDIKNTVAVAGQGVHAGNDWATTARARDGRFVISYLPSPRALKIDLSKISGKQARVSWMDAATGVVFAGGTVATRGTKLFSPPEADDKKDWLLVLDDAKAQLAQIGPRVETSPALQSIDHQGNCRKGAPAEAGETVLLPKEKGLSLVAYGSEYGHHCGQDQGRFAYVPLSGDFDVAVQVSAVTNSGALHYKQHPTPAKAGLMVREGNNPADRYVAIWAVSNDTGDLYPDAFHFDARMAREAWLGSKPKGEFAYGYINRKHGDLFTRAYPKVWLRLKRTGDTVAAFVSKDGKTWAPPSTPAFEVPLPKVVYVGVALSSAPEGGFDARSTATFKNLSGLRRQ